MTAAPRADPDAVLTAEQVEELHRALADARARLVASQRTAEREAGETAGCPQDVGDAAGYYGERHRARRLSEHQQDELLEVEAALERLRQGRYGVCEETGQPIGFGRLQAQPWARFCAEAQAQSERSR